MKTEEKNAAPVQGTAVKAAESNRISNRPSIPGKDARNDEAPKDQKPAQVPEAPATPPTKDNKTGNATGADHQPGNPSEPGKTAVKEAQAGEAVKINAEPVKIVPNLEQTLKAVNDLHRLSIQRLALIARIRTLEDFEVKLIEESDELENNPYDGCKLIIKDDKGRDFTTKTPGLIRMVAQFIFDACHEKLAEIEAHIIFPA